MRYVQFNLIRCIVVTLFVGIAIAEEANAQVWRFLPSDAYFHGSLTRELIKSFDDVKDEVTVTLKYNVPAGSHAHGYNTLEIESVSKLRRKRLSEIYEDLRTRQPAIYEITETEDGEKRRELNGMDLLVYNKSFDWKSYRVGLRYNERWAADGSHLYLQRDFVSYPVSVDPLPNYVIEDWRNSDLVDPLNLKLPSFPGRSARELQYTAATIASNQIQMIVVPHGQLEWVRSKGGPSGYFVVEDEKVLKVFLGEDGQSQEEWHFAPKKASTESQE